MKNLSRPKIPLNSNYTPTVMGGFLPDFPNDPGAKAITTPDSSAKLTRLPHFHVFILNCALSQS